MARPKKNSQTNRKAQTTVPVASRTADRRAAGAGRGSGDGAQGGIAKPQRDRLDFVGYAVLAVVTIFFLLTVSVPLNNYYEGRSEIARLNESIAAKSAEKERLLSEIDKYKSESYIEQEARRRLGVVAPGETAYRIIDPGMSAEGSVTTDKQAEADARSWYTVLYDSVAEPPTESAVPVASAVPAADAATPSAAPDPAAVAPAADPALETPAQ